ncbi:MAG: hypothetical protein GX062_01890 [Firmicutes bacterium]|jgi:hypothetical protein|nr:hypothetical protein [Bacillota bacterium]
MLPIVINIFYLKINSVENASAINIGENYLVDWTNADKRNQGYGQNLGDGSDFVASRYIVDDRDGVDAPTYKQSLHQGDQQNLLGRHE